MEEPSIDIQRVLSETDFHNNMNTYVQKQWSTPTLNMVSASLVSKQTELVKVTAKKTLLSLQPGLVGEVGKLQLTAGFSTACALGTVFAILNS